jgi:hypothetical protein
MIQDKARLQEAAKFSDLSAAIKGPYQETAFKNSLAIKKEAGISTTRFRRRSSGQGRGKRQKVAKKGTICPGCGRNVTAHTRAFLRIQWGATWNLSCSTELH